MQHLRQDRQALNQYQQALKIHRELGDRSGEARVLLNLGVLHQGEGRLAEAEHAYRLTLAIETELGEPEILWRLWNELRRLWRMFHHQTSILLHITI